MQADMVACACLPGMQMPMLAQSRAAKIQLEAVVSGICSRNLQPHPERLDAFRQLTGGRRTEMCKCNLHTRPRRSDQSNRHDVDAANIDMEAKIFVCSNMLICLAFMSGGFVPNNYRKAKFHCMDWVSRVARPAGGRGTSWLFARSSTTN